MSNNQNTILDEMRAEAIGETPLGELFLIVGGMLGRVPTKAELHILTEYLKGFSSDIIKQCEEVILGTITIDKVH